MDSKFYQTMGFAELEIKGARVVRIAKSQSGKSAFGCFVVSLDTGKELVGADGAVVIGRNGKALHQTEDQFFYVRCLSRKLMDEGFGELRPSGKKYDIKCSRAMVDSYANAETGKKSNRLIWIVSQISEHATAVGAKEIGKAQPDEDVPF